MKKITALILLIAMSLFALSGCSSSKEVVNVYNWGEYIDSSIIEDFEKQTGIKVNYRTFESNEQLYSVLKQGGSNYDVIIPSDYMAARLIEEDMLEPINYDNIPSFKDVDNNFKSLAYDPQDKYTVPYMWGTVGIIYNTELISEEIDSWSALFDSRYKGQILQFDNSRDAVATALFLQNSSVNTTDEGEIRAAFELLTMQKDIKQKYVMDQIYDLLESGEAAIGPYYAGDYLSMIENNDKLAFVMPKEGTNSFVDVMAIPKGAENKDNAEKFIEFMTTAEVSYKNMLEIGYASPNLLAKEMLAQDYDMSNADDAYEFSIIYPSDEILAKTEVFTHLPQETLKLYADLWTKLKS